MANLKQRLHRKNSSGTYDVIHLEVDLSNVVGVLSTDHGGTGTNIITDVEAVDAPEPYVHPTTKQCNYSYTHPTTKQCNYSYTHPSAKQCDAVIPDISNYYTKTEIDDLLRPITPQPPSSHTPGDIITWYGYQWLVCHYDSNMNQVYLITKDIISMTEFGVNNIYAGSILASVANDFKNELNSNALSQCIAVGVNGVVSKVFVPSYQQMNGENGGFSWFNSSDHRKASYNGTTTQYWTSSTGGSNALWGVQTSGNLNYGQDVSLGSTDSNGFRPCVCVQL